MVDVDGLCAKRGELNVLVLLKQSGILEPNIHWTGDDAALIGNWFIAEILERFVLSLNQDLPIGNNILEEVDDLFYSKKYGEGFFVKYIVPVGVFVN